MTRARDQLITKLTLDKCLMLQTQVYRCVLWKLMEEVCEKDRMKVIDASIASDEQTKGISPETIDWDLDRFAERYIDILEEIAHVAKLVQQERRNRRRPRSKGGVLEFVKPGKKPGIAKD
jgi:hypothetical protein